MQQKEMTILSAVILMLIVGLFGYAFGKNEAREHRRYNAGAHCQEKVSSESKMSPMSDHSQMTMSQMTEGLEGLSGDAFDKAFVEMMIVHHQGAVDMAKLIPTQAKHAELKKLGNDIIKAQTKEIEMMQSWLKTWGYSEPNEPQAMPMESMDHSMMKH